MKKFIILWVFAALFFVTNAAGTASAEEVPKGLVKVKLEENFINQTAINVGIVGKYIVDSDRRLLDSESIYTIKAENGTLKLYRNSVLVKDYGTSFSIHPDKYDTNNYVSLGRNKYTGVFTFQMEGNYIRPVNTLLVEDYLKGVVPKEMSGSWNVETLKAQALAARTFFMGKKEGFINDTQKNQVYGGLTYWAQNSNRAVEETNGQVIKYNGSYISAMYSSSNGGTILSNRNSWGSPLVSYLSKKEDPYDVQSAPDNKNIDWDYIIKKNQLDLTGKDLSKPELWWNSAKEYDETFAAKVKQYAMTEKLIASNSDLRIYGISAMDFKKPEFTSEEVLTGTFTIHYYRKRTDTGQFIKDSTGKLLPHTLKISGRSYDIRNFVGYKVMMSPFVKKVVENTDSFVVHGGGFGHGIGMSQWGAKVMGDQGKGYREILSFYYPNTVIETENYDYPVIAVPSLNADAESPQIRNTPVTFTAGATGGYDKVYRFSVHDGEKWSIVQEYSSKNTYLWRSSESGSYKIRVHIKDKFSTRDYDTYKDLDYSIATDVKVNSVTADKPAPQAAGTAITIKGNATGGKEKLYKFNILENGVWKTVQNYSSSDTFIWNPSAPGDYKFSVHVKDSSSLSPYDAYGVMDYIITDTQPVVMNQIVTDKPSPQMVKTPITITADATGGKTKLYKFNVYDGKSWSVAQGYSPSSTLNWTPQTAGSYKISVHVKDEASIRSYDSYKAITYTVAAPVAISGLATDKVSPQVVSTTITATAKASGGTTKLYRFWIYDGTAWKKVQEYSPSNVLKWTPLKAGTYKLNVHVKDQTSPKAYDVYKVIEFKINAAATVQAVDMTRITTNLLSPQRMGTAVTLTANATGGTQKQYKFWVNDGLSWKLLRDYSLSNKFTWKPLKAGQYKFSVHVKDAASTKVYDDYGTLQYTIK